MLPAQGSSKLVPACSFYFRPLFVFHVTYSNVQLLNSHVVNDLLLASQAEAQVALTHLCVSVIWHPDW